MVGVSLMKQQNKTHDPEKENRVQIILKRSTFDELNRVIEESGCSSKAEWIRLMIRVHSTILSGQKSGDKPALISEDGSIKLLMIL